MKLSKKDRATLEQIYGTLSRGSAYLLNESVVVCTRRKMATTTQDFTSPSGECITPITKDIGTELVLIQDALSKLGKILFPA